MTCITELGALLDEQLAELGTVRVVAGRAHAHGNGRMHMGRGEKFLVVAAETEAGLVGRQPPGPGELVRDVGGIHSRVAGGAAHRDRGVDALALAEAAVAHKAVGFGRISPRGRAEKQKQKKKDRRPLHFPPLEKCSINKSQAGKIINTIINKGALRLRT
jgi:hypothetical protein